MNFLWIFFFLGIILADTQVHADEAAKAVQVNYTNPQTPILTLDDAINKNSFFPSYPNFPTGGPVTQGNVTTGFNNSGKLDHDKFLIW